jgi:glyoxylase-like metal-dependent hydrolase (beta-lactamase superfamily II)
MFSQKEKIMKKKLLLLLTVLISTATSFSRGILHDDGTRGESAKESDRLALVTYVSDNIQLKHAGILIESLRRNAGKYSDSKVYVVVTDSLTDYTALGEMPGVIILKLNPGRDIARYPYAVKPFAAACAEAAIGRAADYIAWFDPETAILSQPDGLVPGNRAPAVIQPVFLSNTVGQAPDEPLNDYWAPVYRASGTEKPDIPIVETLIDRQRIRAYYNCVIFSVRSDAGIMKAWADAMERLLSDSLYAYVTCNTPQRMTFLHQAAFSAVITAKTSASPPAVLPLSDGFPLHMTDKIVKTGGNDPVESAACVILENLWISDPSWLDKIHASDKVTGKLADLYLQFLEIAPGIYRQEGSCNSYLVLSGDSSILIDPAGSASCPAWFRKITDDHPLSLIVLTHGHNDHSFNTDQWSGHGTVPVIAQRELTGLTGYQEMLSGFFRHRNAIWSGRDDSSFSDTLVSKPVITQYYTDSLLLKSGNLTLHIWHTSGETPDHSVIYIPEKEAVFIGDNYYSSFPNLYTLRGTKPRWALDYVSALDRAISADPVYLFPGHGAWLQGKKQVALHGGGYRDAIKYIHDETVKGMNAGIDRYTLMREITLPPCYSAISQTYGTVKWSVRGIYEGYAGWFDEKPSSMYDLPLSSISGDLIGLAGADRALGLARSYLEKKDYIRGLHLTELILTASPGLPEALELEKEILTCLRKQSVNYIERIWLNYGLSQCSGKK